MAKSKIFKVVVTDAETGKEVNSITCRAFVAAALDADGTGGTATMASGAFDIPIDLLDVGHAISVAVKHLGSDEFASSVGSMAFLAGFDPKTMGKVMSGHDKLFNALKWDDNTIKDVKDEEISDGITS